MPVLNKFSTPARQNDFFNAAARSVFKAATRGSGQPRAVLNNLARAASERRILVWSAREDEQRVLAPTAIAGRLAGRPTSAPHVGVYLNAAQPYKLDYYLDYEASLEPTSCQDSRQHLTLRMKLHSRAPRNVDFLSEYVAPRGQLFGRGTIVSTLFFFAPVDGSPSGLEVDGRPEEFETQKLASRVVFARTVSVKPGQTRNVTVRMVTGPGQTDPAVLSVTPGVRSTGVGTIGSSAC